jgi:hypothetical protein
MLELVNLGTDVTKFRTRLQKNYPYLADDQSFAGLIELNRGNKSIGKSDILRHFIELTESFVTTTFMLKSLEEVYKRPFLINRYALLFLEIYFGQESEYPLKENRLKYLSHLCEQRIHDINEDEDIEPLTKLLHYHRIEHLQDLEYPFYFALTLRQTDVLQIPDFLKHNSKSYEGDYLAFLDLLLVDFEDVFMEKTKLVVREWIQTQQEEIILLKKTAFLPVPKGWKRIEGRLEPSEIKSAFSFLYEIAEFTQDGVGYLTPAEVAELLEYGIAFPKGDQEVPQFRLNLNRERSRQLFVYAIYQIRAQHSFDTWDSEGKLEWAQFLKRRFTNFSKMSIAQIKNEIRNRLPKSVPLGFEIKAYFGSN